MGLLNTSLVDAEDEAVEVILGRGDGLLLDHHWDVRDLSIIGEAGPVESPCAAVEALPHAVVVCVGAVAVVVDLVVFAGCLKS